MRNIVLLLSLMLANLILASPTRILLADQPVGNESLFERLDTNADGQIAEGEISPEHRRLFDRLLFKSDCDQNGTLSVSEFSEALAVDRPVKPIVEKMTGRLPGADAVLLLLLLLDTNGDSNIEMNEVPVELLDTFDQMVEQFDRNKDDQISRMEVSRANAPLSRLAKRYAREHDLDVTRLLAKLRKKQGKLVDRFDQAQTPGTMLSDPARAKELFSQLDSDGNGSLKLDEVPEQFQNRFTRLIRIADRNQNDELSEEEFLRGAKRVGKFMQRYDKSD